TIKVIVSHRRLLIFAALAENSMNKALVGKALVRLKSPAGDFPPVLVAVKQASPYRWRLTINPFWRPVGKYVAVPLPLPADGRVVLALHLFSHQLYLESKWAGSTLASLTRHLGLPSRPTHARRELTRALTL